jgi:hypothetical protein
MFYYYKHHSSSSAHPSKILDAAPATLAPILLNNMPFFEEKKT